MRGFLFRGHKPGGLGVAAKRVALLELNLGRPKIKIGEGHRQVHGFSHETGGYSRVPGGLKPHFEDFILAHF